MFNRKHMIILLIFIIAFGAISCVSAVDDNATDDTILNNNDIIGDVSNENVAINDVDISKEKTKVSTVKNVNDDSKENAVADENDNNIVSGTSMGTFNDLQSLINRYSTVTLSQDYYFDPDIDDEDLEAGLDINHDLTINGNGHTIYGNGARMMWIYSGNTVLINNLNFVNIFDDETLESEDGITAFNNGGAIYNAGGLVYLDSCEFYYNLAFVCGGAIYNTENGILMVDNCLFINNTITNNDDAYAGGAIYSQGELFVLDSGFGNNYAAFGGAIGTLNEAYIVDSVFINNHAYMTGGAIFNYDINLCHASGCTFNGNKAQYGGGTHNVIAINCDFDKYNVASTGQGHNMRNGVAIDCTAADRNANNFYNTIISTGFSFEPDNLIYTSGTKNKNFDVVVTSNPDGETVQAVNVVLNIDGEDTNTTVRTDENGVASFSLPVLSNGIHTFSVNLKYSSFNDTVVDYDVVVGKLNSTIKFSNNKINFNYGGYGTTTVTLDGCTISQAYVENYPGASVQFNSNSITVSGLDAGNYNLRVVGNPDSTHNPTEATIPITVSKVDSTATFNTNQLNFDYGGSGSITATLDGCTLSQGNAYVTGAAAANVIVNGNMITVSGLNAGTYTLQVTTSPDANHNAAVKTIPITVNKIASSINFNNNAITFDYLKSGYVTFTADGGSVSRANVYVVDHVSDAGITISGNMITVSNLDAGYYTLHVETTPDANHISSVAELPIVVNKVTAYINQAKLTTVSGSGDSWSIKVTDSSGMAVPNKDLTLNVYTGSSYVPYQVKTNELGVALFSQASTLSIGTHTVTISGSDNNYNINTVTSSITVNKKVTKTKLKITVKKASLKSGKGKGGYALTVYVKNKKTGKNVYGVKVKLYISGSKYQSKPLTLITTKDSKKSAVGYATNALSKGTHKVRIVISTSKYTGSKNTKMVIKKTGKWTLKLTG